MKIACIADLHGNLPAIPGGIDLLLIGGDITPQPAKVYTYQRAWLDGPFRSWLGPIAGRCPVVAVAGNHDWVFQGRPDMVPDLPWTYLRDSAATVHGLKIWGSPWQPTFHRWAFNLDEPDLGRKWSLIPDGVDVLLLHGPPFGVGDFSTHGAVNTGSPSLARRIEDLKPKLVVNGHIHSGRGVYRLGGSVVVNAAILNEQYEICGGPFVVDTEDWSVEEVPL